MGCLRGNRMALGEVEQSQAFTAVSFWIIYSPARASLNLWGTFASWSTGSHILEHPPHCASSTELFWRSSFQRVHGQCNAWLAWRGNFAPFRRLAPLVWSLAREILRDHENGSCKVASLKGCIDSFVDSLSEKRSSEITCPKENQLMHYAATSFHLLHFGNGCNGSCFQDDRK